MTQGLVQYCSPEFHTARSAMFCHHANFMSCSSSNLFAPKEACRSSAVCSLAENSFSQETNEAWEGRTSSAMWARVGKSRQCFYVYITTAELYDINEKDLPPTPDNISILCDISQHVLQVHSSAILHAILLHPPLGARGNVDQIQTVMYCSWY